MADAAAAADDPKKAAEGAAAKKAEKARRKAEFDKKVAEQGAPAKKVTNSKQQNKALQNKQRAAKSADSPPPAASSDDIKPAAVVVEASQQGAATSGTTSPVRKLSDAGTRPASKMSVRQPPPPPPSVSQQQSEARPLDRAPSVLAHLGCYTRFEPRLGLRSAELHPAVVSLGYRYATGETDGANGRCVAILAALKEAIRSYALPSGATMNRDLDKKLRPMIAHLFDCRPHSASMGHAIKHVRSLIANLEPNIPTHEAKRDLCEAIDRYVHERIVLPGTVIAERGLAKVRDGDVILTYGPSDAVVLLLAKAHEVGRKFRVVVVDSRPLLSGRKLLKKLHHLGIDTTYVWLHGLSYICREASKVIIGAESLLSNGAVLARAGTASVAMMAKAHNIPVLVCCETYKFHDRVQLDSVCWNELGDPAALQITDEKLHQTATREPHQPQKCEPCSSSILHLRFDVTPPTYVDVIVTEHGLVPPSACAVLIRELAQTIEVAD